MGIALDLTKNWHAKLWPLSHILSQVKSKPLKTWCQSGNTSQQSWCFRCETTALVLQIAFSISCWLLCFSSVKPAHTPGHPAVWHFLITPIQGFSWQPAEITPYHLWSPTLPKGGSYQAIPYRLRAPVYAGVQPQRFSWEAWEPGSSLCSCTACWHLAETTWWGEILLCKRRGVTAGWYLWECKHLETAVDSLIHSQKRVRMASTFRNWQGTVGRMLQESLPPSAAFITQHSCWQAWSCLCQAGAEHCPAGYPAASLPLHSPGRGQLEGLKSKTTI